MKNAFWFLTSIVLLVVLSANLPVALACSESALAPVFDYKYAPENPFANFAAGNIGIVKPTYRRAVLFAAYRYLNNQGFSADEQKALVEVWNAEFRNEDPPEKDITEAVRTWLERRKQAVPDEEKLPEIYAERRLQGGYDYFPNCGANAFETATETLSSRISSYGADDKNVREWVRGQDAVFANCSNGQSLPAELEEFAPEWLRRDRAYQTAAAKFYSLDLDDARRRFAAISDDDNSVWKETADYLVGRTLVRQASFIEDETKRAAIYAEAETHLTMRANQKFPDAAQKLVNLIKLRTRPEERVRELAQILPAPQSGGDLRQNLIDYTWTLDRFESDVLKAEENRKEEIKQREENQKSVATDANTNVTNSAVVFPNANAQEEYKKTQAGETLSFWLNKTEAPPMGDGNTTGFSFDVKMSDEEIYKSAAEKLGRDLTDKDKEKIRQARAYSYQSKIGNRQISDYQGDYYGGEKMTMKLLPQFLREDDLTDWLFTFQIQEDENAYDYSLEKWRQTKSDLWLMTALSKAMKNSAGLPDLMRAAEKVERGAPARPTIAYHAARIFLEQDKQTEARKLLDDILYSNAELPVSSRNQFAELRMKVAETLDDFLKNSGRKPFTFASFENSTTIDEAIAEQKSWWDAENYKQTKEEWDRETEEQFAVYKLWENRSMFDENTVEIINQQFPLPVLLDAEKSAALPDYLRERLAVVVWTRAALLENDAVLQKIAPRLLKLAPEIEEYLKAKTPQQKRLAALYVVYKHKEFVPLVESGFIVGAQIYVEDAGWWCGVSAVEYEEYGKQRPRKPAFLTDEQANAARAEMKKLEKIGSAPHFLGEKALEWLKLAPRDKRLPQILYAAFKVNAPLRYGCGEEELRMRIADALTKRFPDSNEARQVYEELNEENQ